MVTALNVCNNILQRSFLTKTYITPMKLQKLLYLTYKKFFQDTNGYSLFAEPFEVWKYGPVVRSVYDFFKEYKASEIREYKEDCEGNIIAVDERSSPIFRKSVNYVWNKYGEYDGIILSSMTHRKDTAWWKAFKEKRKYLSDKDIGDEQELIP